MQYVITLPSAPFDTERFAELVEAEDPSALVDRAPDTAALRLSTCLSHRELQTLAGEAGTPLAIDAIEQLPSECCGGCGG